jgi:hypothetical protein
VELDEGTWFKYQEIRQGKPYRELENAHCNIPEGNISELNDHLNPREHFGQTQVLFTCFMNQTECAHVLLEEMADFATPSGNRLTPLYVLM